MQLQTLEESSAFQKKDIWRKKPKILSLAYRSQLQCVKEQPSRSGRQTGLVGIKDLLGRKQDPATRSGSGSGDGM